MCAQKRALSFKFYNPLFGPLEYMIGQGEAARLMTANTQVTKEAAVALDAKLKNAMEEAHLAGLMAFEEFFTTSGMVHDGVLYDTAGGAFVKVASPSYHFREALKRLYPGARGSGGVWTLNIGFGRMPSKMNQSITADEVYCKAAVSVMLTHFPTQEFFYRSYID
jgi:hypothetical protein